MQYFKGDDLEKKFVDAGSPPLDDRSIELGNFFDGAYTCHVLGEVLWDNEFAPLANAIKREVFRTSFAALFDSFLEAGSFESYLTVFRAVFGANVEVTFTVPAAGKLNIAINAVDVVLSDFVARDVSSGSLDLQPVVDYTPDNIAFQTVQGFESQYELEQMLFEMVPGGVYTEITLTLGV